MSRLLTIDRGNTTTKIALWSDNELLSTATVVGADTNAVLKALPSMQVEGAAICTVAGPFDGLAEELARHGVKLVTLTRQTPLPISIHYSTPETLGVDRIAAAVGAQSLFPGNEVLIVDIGTAVTYDRVSAQGAFIGGNIAPGIGMRLRALHTFTKALPEVKSAGPTPLWGDSTETAMRAGVINGVAAEVTYYRSKLPTGGVTILAGGWSKGIAERLDFDVELAPMLVNRGLNHIFNPCFSSTK